MREVARYDYDKALQVERWPLVEVLHAYMGILRAAALDSYHRALMLWSAIAPHSKEKLPAPKRPPILDD